MAVGFDVRTWNVILLGLAFMFIFTAFQTTSIIEPYVLQQMKANNPNSSDTGDGYVSLGIVYSVFTFSNWLAPSFVNIFGPRVSMFCGGICYLLFILSLIKPYKYLLYPASVLVGLGASIIWTGQGNFLTLNSDRETMPRNSGIFWALLQCSLLFGNVFVFFEFGGSKTITNEQRRMVFIVFSVVCCIGILLLVLLRKAPVKVEKVLTSEDVEPFGTKSRPGPPKTSGALEALKTSFKLFFTRDMMLLSLCFAYTGIELTFFSGVYGTAVGNTHKIKDSQKMIGLSGAITGVGEIIGGLAFGIFGKRTNKLGRDPIVLLGMLVHWAAFIMIFLNIPSHSPMTKNLDDGYITPNVYIALVCSFLLGLGDSSFNTQIYSILGHAYADDSAPAFALFKFMQSLFAAVAFFYSQEIQLQWQLLILVITSLFGTVGFFVVEWKVKKQDQLGYQRLN